MNHTKKITLVLSLLAAGASHAQTTATTTDRTGYGLLGHRFTEVKIGLENIDQVSNHGHSVGVAANDPVIPGVLDAGASYSYSWINGPFKGHANTIGAYATGYAPLGELKPFATAALGYRWTSLRFGSGKDEAIWGAAAGVEIPVGRITLTPRVSYADDFNGSPRSRHVWTTQVEANYWYNRTSAVFASIGRADVRHSSFDSWNGEIGLRARF